MRSVLASHFYAIAFGVIRMYRSEYLLQSLMQTAFAAAREGGARHPFAKRWLSVWPQKI